MTTRPDSSTYRSNCAWCGRRTEVGPVAEEDQDGNQTVSDVCFDCFPDDPPQINNDFATIGTDWTPGTVESNELCHQCTQTKWHGDPVWRVRLLGTIPGGQLITFCADCFEANEDFHRSDAATHALYDTADDGTH